MQAFKRYAIYQHPDGRLEAVKIGWSWPAFFFSGIWALFKRLWLHASVYFLLSLIMLSIEAEAMDDPVVYSMIYMLDTILVLIISSIFGFRGNDWRRKNLLSRGFEFRGRTLAQSVEHAIARYLKQTA